MGDGPARGRGAVVTHGERQQKVEALARSIFVQQGAELAYLVRHDPDFRGYGKILTGSGEGECRRLACVTGGPIRDPARCDCPAGYEKKKGAKGEQRCVLVKAAAASKAK